MALLTVVVLFALPAWAETKRIFAVPEQEWDHLMSQGHPARIFTPTDLSDLTGGILFGLSPTEVNTRLPSPAPGIDWASLPFANEFPEVVRYFWVRPDAAPALAKGIEGCVGAASYVVFLFRRHGLFRISWRLLPDTECPSTTEAAEDVFARYLAIDRTISIATHYRAGGAEVVEITDPNADYLLPYRWTNRKPR